MKTQYLTVLVPGIFAAAAFVVAVSVGAQMPSPPATAPAATSPHAAAMTGQHKSSSAGAKHDADMKTECQAMMAKKSQMQDKLQAMDGALDKLVAEMNAAKGSKEVDAMEKPMAAVLNELVVQRKALRSMTTEMQPEMTAHMTHHVHMHGTKGTVECPMMKSGPASERKAEEKKPPM
jgi:Skp family chaperone for outer membrane proteins